MQKELFGSDIAYRGQVLDLSEQGDRPHDYLPTLANIMTKVSLSMSVFPSPLCRDPGNSTRRCTVSRALTNHFPSLGNTIQFLDPEWDNRLQMPRWVVKQQPKDIKNRRKRETKKQSTGQTNNLTIQKNVMKDEDGGG